MSRGCACACFKFASLKRLSLASRESCGLLQILFTDCANCSSVNKSPGVQKPGRQWNTMPSELRTKICTLCGPAPLVVTTAGVFGSCLPDLPQYDSSLMFLNPQTNLLFSVRMSVSWES